MRIVAVRWLAAHALYACLMKLTGGRPMTMEYYRFHSEDTHRPVYYFKDWYGRRWLAEGPWSLVRVEVGLHII